MKFLVKISLVKCVVNWSLGQFETFVVQICIFDRLWPLGCYIVNYSYPKLNIYIAMEQVLCMQIDYLLDLSFVQCDLYLQSCIL